MPRRRPAALRHERARTARRSAIDHLSSSCTAAVHRLERTRFPGLDTAEAFHRWRSLAHGPLRDLALPSPYHYDCCDPSDARDQLEAVIHALPTRNARELRALVSALDHKILTRNRALRPGNGDSPWWRF
ncbi:hypothetical protein [Streptomyces sp. NPDC002588]|uniref:hypothetical protein n=1 Tax=Streptomyces sp. NPDC002588 TaxID=3154419 RepID=UPI003332B0FA